MSKKGDKNQKNNKELSLEDKLKALNIEEYKGPENLLDILYEQHILKTKPTRNDKLNALGIKTYDGPDDVLDTMYEQLILKNIKEDTDKKPEKPIKKVDKIVEKPTKNINKTTEKYKLLLEFVNRILVNLEKDEVDDLLKFKNINRLDIIKKDHIKILDEYLQSIFDTFPKIKYNYNYKSPNVILNTIRAMCKDLDLTMHRKEKKKQKGNLIERIYEYSIVM